MERKKNPIQTPILIFMFLVTFTTSCNSLSKKDSLPENEEEVVEQMEILASNDESKHMEAIKSLENAIKNNPELAKNEEIQKKGKKLFKTISATCTYSIEEPKTEAFAVEGYSEPVKLNLDCKELDSGTIVPIELKAVDSVRFQSEFKIPTPEIKMKPKNKESVSFLVNALSMNKTQNKIKILGGSFYDDEIENILSKFGVELNRTIIIENNEYAFQNTPIKFSSEYARYVDRLKGISLVSKIGSERMEVAIGNSGAFTFGANSKNESMDLLYGHPNNIYSDDMGTSFVSIYCDGKIVRFNELEKISVTKKTNEEVILTGKLEDREIYFEEIFTQRPDDTIRLGLRAINKEDKSASIGFRILLDTWAGRNDGVPFTMPGSSGKQVVFDKEVRFTPITTSIWETYDVDGDGEVFLRGIYLGDGVTPPDELIFSNWQSSFDTDWNYEIRPEVSVTGDSSVIAFWKPRTISPNDSILVSSDYGYVERKTGINFELKDEKKGSAYLHFDLNSQGENEFRFSLESDKGKISSEFPDNKIQFTNDSKPRVQRSFLLNLFGEGEMKLTLKDEKTGKVYEFIAKLSSESRGASPKLWNNSFQYPVVYLSDETGLKLRAVLRDKFSNQIITTGVMKENAKKDGKYFYEALLEVNNLEGNYLTEIEEIE
ncbi:MAG: hypothetical protein SFU98_19020 [Leptospiraceae bacterium]|nr:hypothetical protein [Leptospiraceae bacterium]